MTAAALPPLRAGAPRAPAWVRRLGLLAAAGALGALGVLRPAVAQTVPEGLASEGEARAWLWRIHQAQRSSNFQGTLVFSADGALATSRVLHYVVGSQVVEQVESLDGRHQRIVRHNDLVHTLLPGRRTAIVEKRETLAAWSATPQMVDPQALEQYALHREGLARVAGRDAVVLRMDPRDALRYAQRLWADLASGLMLRADMLDAGPDRALLESTSFTEVEIGVRPQPEAVLKHLRQLDGWRVVRPQQQRTTLEDEGWALARPVPGFRLAGCVRRGMENAGEADASVLQAVFTDGLTHVSLFVEPFDEQRHRREMQARQGATSTVMQRRGQHWITAVGNVPAATLKQLAESLERRR
ncbi:MAG: MucB/RseB C-terminal domain-containing protein [Rubrivivax sp.]|nr:MucB/RseB C-terminal domain-containing protein [Rubrivivax sp.]